MADVALPGVERGAEVLCNLLLEIEAMRKDMIV